MICQASSTHSPVSRTTLFPFVQPPHLFFARGPPQQLVLKWEAQRKAVHIRQEWESSALISCDADVMASQLSRAVRAHAFAVKTAGGADEVSASCEATLAHLGRVVEAVGFLHNRDLTAAYWERVEQAMPLREVSAERSVAARATRLHALMHRVYSPCPSSGTSCCAQTILNHSTPTTLTLLHLLFLSLVRLYVLVWPHFLFPLPGPQEGSPKRLHARPQTCRRSGKWTAG